MQTSMTMAELIAYSRAISDGDGHTSLRDFDIDAKIVSLLAIYPCICDNW
jgi:hypothetical protein